MYGFLSRASPPSANNNNKATHVDDSAIREAKSLMGDTPLNSPPASTGSARNGKKRLSSTTTSNNKNGSTAARSIRSNVPLEDQLADAREQIAKEKAGKRKLFHSLVKLANELRRMRDTSTPLVAQQKYADRHWYEGGLWRAPAVLPSVAIRTQQSVRPRQAISLSDLFFSLVIVTAFTRVGVAISQRGHVDGSSFLYFCLFWTVWSKEASYSTRFDTTDLSARAVTLVTCFAVLFASLSVQAQVASPDGNRIMMMGAGVAVLHTLLHVRVALTKDASDLGQHVLSYAVFNIAMTTLEACMWFFGIFVAPQDYRWIVFLGALLLALRFPRAFLANDFHAACSKRGVLFILLLGFLLQSMVVVASEFFEYQTPTLEDYGFLGSACLMFFCIKLLYVDDSDTLAEDHALLVNRWAGFFFHAGNFSLLFSTTVMGSGLNLLTHSYLSATAALPGPAKTLVCGGFAAVLLSTFFIKSMHIKRVPMDRVNQALFLAAYVVQSIVLLAVVAVTLTMSFRGGENTSILEVIYESDMMLLASLSGAALVVLVTSWLDDGVAVALYSTTEDSRAFRVHPFGFWWCLRPEVDPEEVEEAIHKQEEEGVSSRRLSALSPLLGSSVASLKVDGYDSLDGGSEHDRSIV